LAHFEREFSGPLKPSGKELDMKKSRDTEEQIAFALKQAEAGTPVAEVIRRMGISEQTFYRWKKVYGLSAAARLSRNSILYGKAMANPQTGLATS